MFEKLGHTLVRRKKSVFALYLVAILFAGAIGSGVFSRLESGGYSDPNSDSYKAYEYLQDVFKVEDPSVVLVIESGKAASDPTVFASVAQLESKIQTEQHVGKTLSYWSTGGAPTLLSKDGKAGFLFIYSDKSDWGTIQQLGKDIQKKYDGKFQDLKVYASGTGVFAHSINTKISDDLKLAESISIPLTFILWA